MTENETQKICPYCQGQGFYITHTWGVKNKNICGFCSGQGKAKDKSDDKK